MNSSKRGKEPIEEIKFMLEMKSVDLENMVTNLDSVDDGSTGMLEIETAMKQLLATSFQLRAADFKLQTDNLTDGTSLTLPNAGDDYIALIKHIAKQKPAARRNNS